MLGSRLGHRLVQGASCAVLACALLIATLASPTSAKIGPTYTQPVFIEWNRKALDVLIVPPHHGQLLNGHRGTRLLNNGDPKEINPLANSYITAFLRSVTDWRRAIKTWGSRSLRQLKLNVYVLGRDTPPTAALQQPEVVVTWDETKGPILGQSSRFGAGNTASPCVIQNSMLALNSFSAPDMYNVAGHEFGHCLGLDHAVGAKDIKGDLMYAQYGQDIGLEDNPLKCISNLNVRTLELVYDNRSQPTAVTMPVRDYKRIRCG